MTMHIYSFLYIFMMWSISCRYSNLAINYSVLNRHKILQAGLLVYLKSSMQEESLKKKIALTKHLLLPDHLLHFFYFLENHVSLFWNSCSWDNKELSLRVWVTSIYRTPYKVNVFLCVFEARTKPKSLFDHLAANMVPCDASYGKIWKSTDLEK